MERLFWMGMMPRLTAAGAGLAVADDPAAIIGSSKQLFFDDYVIEKMDGLKRTVHPAAKHNNGRPVLVPDKPWEGRQVWMFGSVLYNPDKKMYEMWYRCGAFPTIFQYAYAVSKDGITWQKPISATPPQVQKDFDWVEQVYPDYYGGRKPTPPRREQPGPRFNWGDSIGDAHS